mgnify:CR=1 FL=1
MRHSISKPDEHRAHLSADGLSSSHSMRPSRRLKAWLGGLIIVSGLGGCVTGKAQTLKKNEPIGEAELAAKKLQEPLDKHLCKARIHPIAKADWKLTRVVSLVGRGPSFLAALEALCREADGNKYVAVVDLYYERAVTAWSPNHAVRGTAVRFGEGFEPPEPPDLTAISPPPMPKATDEEPLPAGEATPPPPPPAQATRSAK